MTIKYFRFFAFSLFISYYLLTSLFSSKGFFVNKSLNSELAVKISQEEELQVLVDAKQAEVAQLKNGSGLLDGLYQLGYIEEGDIVMRLNSNDFSAGSVSSAQMNKLPIKQVEPFKPWKRINIFFISFFFSLALTALCSIISTILNGSVNDKYES